jgi:hypothetical protein
LTKKPIYQRIITWFSYVMIGFIAFGTFLDSMSNAVSLVQPMFTYMGSLALIFLWALTELILRKRPLHWIIDSGATVRLQKLGAKPRLMIMGIIILLWIPQIVDLKNHEIPLDSKPTISSHNTSSGD